MSSIHNLQYSKGTGTARGKCAVCGVKVEIGMNGKAQSHVKKGGGITCVGSNRPPHSISR